ncbi:hypothetical protein PV682_20435 [Streptomyces niveiscabiei]|uniref:hypothetical protein n=1 Tax=Streptomyces niveiscabiei TaxID=164115 RepID=UPI0029A01677|nr:hypothetical protein [Streptomyces niveiscabiei]MDX3383812.1 hypothetical protein [Streptomyces niveiscabiei]
MKTLLKRGSIVAASAAVLVGFASAPAFAGNINLSLPSGRGTMTFIDDGDKFRVCDTKADGYGVTGYVQTINTRGDIITVATIDDGGDAGCDTKEYDIYLNKPHEMKLCWHGGGACVYSGTFDE